MRPICLPCLVFMKPMQNGAIVQAGNEYLYACDRYACPNCATEMLTGFSRQPVAERYQGEPFTDLLPRSLGRVDA